MSVTSKSRLTSYESVSYTTSLVTAYLGLTTGAYIEKLLSNTTYVRQILQHPPQWDKLSNPSVTNLLPIPFSIMFSDANPIVGLHVMYLMEKYGDRFFKKAVEEIETILYNTISDKEMTTRLFRRFIYDTIPSAPDYLIHSHYILYNIYLNRDILNKKIVEELVLEALQKEPKSCDDILIFLNIAEIKAGKPTALPIDGLSAIREIVQKENGNLVVQQLPYEPRLLKYLRPATIYVLSGTNIARMSYAETYAFIRYLSEVIRKQYGSEGLRSLLNKIWVAYPNTSRPLVHVIPHKSFVEIILEDLEKGNLIKKEVHLTNHDKLVEMLTPYIRKYVKEDADSFDVSAVSTDFKKYANIRISDEEKIYRYPDIPFVTNEDPVVQNKWILRFNKKIDDMELYIYRTPEGVFYTTESRLKNPYGEKAIIMYAYAFDEKLPSELEHTAKLLKSRAMTAIEYLALRRMQVKNRPTKFSVGTLEVEIIKSHPKNTRYFNAYVDLDTGKRVDKVSESVRMNTPLLVIKQLKRYVPLRRIFKKLDGLEYIGYNAHRRRIVFKAGNHYILTGSNYVHLM